MQGPHDDFLIQQFCLAAFLTTFITWVLLSAFYIARVNVLLCLAPFVAHALALLCFIAAACNDPGIEPKNPPTTVKPADSVRWCDECCREKPLGAFHCHTCNVCTHELDHHCGVIGNCVGSRNKFMFLGLIAYTQLFFMFSIVNLGLSLGRFYSELDSAAQHKYSIANWTIGAVELLLMCAVLIEMLLNHFGFGQPNSCVESTHKRIWACIAMPGSNLFVNTMPRVRCRAVKSKVNISPLLLAHQEEEEMEMV